MEQNSKRLVSESKIPLDRSRSSDSDPMELVVLDSFLSSVLTVKNSNPLLHMARAQLNEVCQKYNCESTDLVLVCRVYKLEEGTLQLELNYTPSNNTSKG